MISFFNFNFLIKLRYKMIFFSAQINGNYWKVKSFKFPIIEWDKLFLLLRYRLDEVLISVMYLMYSYILDNDWTVDDEQTFHQIGLWHNGLKFKVLLRRGPGWLHILLYPCLQFKVGYVYWLLDSRLLIVMILQTNYKKHSPIKTIFSFLHLSGPDWYR